MRFDRRVRVVVQSMLYMYKDPRFQDPSSTKIGSNESGLLRSLTSSKQARYLRDIPSSRLPKLASSTHATTPRPLLD